MARGRSPTFGLQRAAMLQQAARLFAEQGFHNTSMAALGQACGVSKALLYHYYRDKEQILFDIADGHVEQLRAIVADVAARSLPPEAHLRALVNAFMSEYANSQASHLVLVQDVKFLRAEQAEAVLDKQRQVVAAFATAIGAVEPGLQQRQLDRMVAMILFGMINWTFTWLKADGRLTHGDVASVIIGILLDGIRGLKLPATSV